MILYVNISEKNLKFFFLIYIYLCPKSFFMGRRTDRSKLWFGDSQKKEHIGITNKLI